MLGIILDDLNTEGIDFIPLVEVDYSPSSLSNILYEIIDDKKKRRKIFRDNKIVGLYADFTKVYAHREILRDEILLTSLIKVLFPPITAITVTATDRLFLNSFYRKLVRARLEEDFHEKDLLKGLVIVGYQSHEIDQMLVGILRILRLICRYLGIHSTTTSSFFPLSKLYMPSFWRDVSSCLIQLFGETRISLIVVEEIDEYNGLNPDSKEIQFGKEIFESAKMRACQAQVLSMLNTVFDIWSGTLLIVEEHVVRVKPAAFVTSLLPKMKTYTELKDK